MEIITPEIVTRLERCIEFANQVFDEHYTDEKRTWTIDNNRLIWCEDIVVAKITPDNAVPLLTVFERAIGHQVAAEPDLITCRLTAGFLTHDFYATLDEIKEN